MRGVILILMIASALPAAESDVDRAKAAAAIFEANRAKFSVWTIEFNYTVGYAKTLDDALAKRWINPSVARGVCTFDGTNGRYDVAYDLKNLAEKRVEVKPGRFQTYLTSHRYLTDGKVTLSDYMRPNRNWTEMDHTVQILPGSDTFHRNIALPLELGRGEFARNFLASQAEMVHKADSGRHLMVREGVKLGEDEVVEFAFSGPDDRREDYTYWVDLKHGAISRKTFAEFPVPDGTRGRSYKFLEDIRDTSDGRWFPFRELSFTEGSGIIHERVITRSEFSAPKDPLAFTLSFEKPVKVYDGARGVSYPAQLAWDLKELPLLVAPKPR